MERFAKLPGVQACTRFQAPFSDELDFHEFLTRQAMHGARRDARVEQIQQEVEQGWSRTVPMAPGTRRLLSQGMSGIRRGHDMVSAGFNC